MNYSTKPGGINTVGHDETLQIHLKQMHREKSFENIHPDQICLKTPSKIISNEYPTYTFFLTYLGSKG